MENSSQKNKQAWVLVIGVLVILALVAVSLVYAIMQSSRQTQAAIQPVNELTSNLATRVAEVLNPTPTVLPDPVTIIAGVRSLARLETIQYTVEKVITAESGQGPFGFLFGDRLILVAHGQVIAGIDLGMLEPGDLQVRDGILYVRLPEPEVFITAIDNQKTKVFSRDTGLLTHGNVTLETAARQAAEIEIEKAALEDGILRQAGQNAQNYLYRLFIELGFPEVIFEEKIPTD